MIKDHEQYMVYVYLCICNIRFIYAIFMFFRSVFEEVETNSLNVWKWEMYRLLDEFDSRPTMPPPLTIIEDIWKLGKISWKKCCRKEKEDCKMSQNRVY